MLNSKDYDVQAARYNQLQHQAAHAALVASARAHHENRPALHALALSKMGELLITIGSRLQDRYGTLIEEANQTPAEAC